MDFDSPETEQEFPGLYTEKKSPDEDGRKILPVKKKKDKDKGYKAFEEDGSGGSHEDVNKSASKSSSRFKFGKAAVKSVLTNPSSKPVKVKIFAVDLKQVVSRNPNDDRKRPLIPRFLARALTYLEGEYKPGVNFYKGTSHFKSKIQSIRHALNYGEELPLQDPQVVAGLVKLFVRELPGHILGPVIESKLEEGRISEKKTKKLQNMYLQDIPAVNRAVFERLIVHMEIIGIDLTPLLRVSQKSLLLLKPVMTPLTVEDELCIEEARLSRIHSSLAKAKASKDKTKTKDNEEKLWEIQRNVTQLKRKLKQINNPTINDEKEVELNCEERKEETDVAVEDGEQQQTQVEPIEVPEESKPETSAPVEEKPETPKFESKIEDAEERMSSSTTESKQVEILQPVQVQLPVQQPVDQKVFDEKVDDVDFTTSTPLKRAAMSDIVPPENVMTEKASLSPFAVRKTPEGEQNPCEVLMGKAPSEDEDLEVIQREWRYAIAEQVELLRLNHDLKRRIRDEHKQIKMIQMVRNHRYRVPPVKPFYQDPLESMSTEKLQEILQRFIDSNKLLTKETEILATKVFNEKLHLAEGRAKERCPVVKVS